MSYAASATSSKSSLTSLAFKVLFGLNPDLAKTAPFGH